MMKQSVRPLLVAMNSLVAALGLGLVIWSMTPQPVAAATCNVPTGSHPNIQSAINDPICNTVQLVNPLYTENIVVNRSLTIQGQGEINTAIDGAGINRVFDIQAGLIVTLTDMTIRNGNAYDGGGIRSLTSTLTLDAVTLLNNIAELGAGLYSRSGQVTIHSSQIMSNSAGILGGGIAGFPVTIINSVITNNQADNFGGGAYGQINLDGSMVTGNKANYGAGLYGSLITATYSLFQDNITTFGCGGGLYTIFGAVYVAHSSFINNATTTTGCGGALFASSASSIRVENSTFSHNSAERGGAIAIGSSVLIVTTSTFNSNSASNLGGGIANISSNGVISITNSTLSDNSAINGGGGIANLGLLSLANSTLSHNASGSGGGIHSTGMLNFSHAIVANSLNGGDCFNSGSIDTNASNLVEDGSCGAVLNGDPLLGLLQDNGGPTWTHALLAGSPAIDAGNNTICPSIDQRGELRPMDGDGDGESVCDIGAYEYGAIILQKLYIPLILKP